MYKNDIPTPDEAAFKALRPDVRANLLLRVAHAWKTVNDHPSSSKHYDAPVLALTWLTEELKVRHIDELATELENRTDRLRTITDSDRNGRRPPVQMRLNGELNTAARAMAKWNDAALREAVNAYQPNGEVPAEHQRYLQKARFYYNTDQVLPFNYKKFMAVTADKGVRLQNFTDRDLSDLVTRTETLLADIAKRTPHELAQWYLAAHGSLQQPPESWRTLYANLQFSSLPRQLVSAMLHYTPESGLVIEQDLPKAMREVRHLVQPAPAR